MGPFSSIRAPFGGSLLRYRNQVDSESKIELGREGLPEIVRHSVSMDPNILKALKRSALDVDLHLWVTYWTFTLKHCKRALESERI